MANPNPSPTTRFKKGNAGRPRGSKNFKTITRYAIIRLSQGHERELGRLATKRAMKLAIDNGNFQMIELLLNYLYGRPK